MSPAAEIQSRLAGALAGRYTIERELGQGGMATVYLAQDLRHRRRVALKVLRQDLAAVIGAERFLKEIETTANLQHPNILPLYDSGEAESFLYYVMPYVEGETLRGKLSREKQLSVEETVAIAKAVAAALEYAHRRGVIHRDIKPENILLPDGQALVADFGIALAVSQAGGTRMTETGLSLGTPHYMSPEQATGDRELSPRSDIYSLGAMTYEMLTGDPPHTGSTVQAIVAKVISEAPTPISRTRNLVPVNVDAAVQRALAKTPADRFASAADFATALSNPGFTLPSLPGVPRVAGTGERTWKRRALVLAALLAVAAGLGVWTALSRPNPPALVTRVQLVLPPGQELTFAFGQRFAFSPDGSQLAYVGEAKEGGRQVWVRPLSALEARPLAGTERAMAPFFSPDGAWVGFIADNKLRKVPVAGGPVVTVADSANQVIAGAAWLSDGTIVYTHDNWNLYRVSQAGGAVTRLPDIDSTGIVFPRALPRPDAVLYTTCNIACLTMTVGALDLSTGKVTRLATDAADAWYLPSGHVLYVRRDGAVFRIPFDVGTLEIRGVAEPVFEGVQVAGGMVPALALSPQGTLLFLSGSFGGIGEIVRVDRTGKAVPIDPTWPASAITSAALSPNGTQLAVEIHNGVRSDVWVKQLDRGPLTRLSFESKRNHRPAWMPDGRGVSFIAVDTTWSISVRRPDGTGELTQVVPPDSLGEPEMQTWSPDGAWLVLQAVKWGRRDLYALKVGSDTVVPIAAASGVDEMAPAISPDGHWIAYASTETGRAEVYLRPFPDIKRERRQVSNAGGRSPGWARNGRELYFVDESQEFFAVGINPAANPTITEPRRLFSAAGFARNAYFGGYLPERGEQSFLFLRGMASSTPSQLVLVLNWAEELKAKIGRSAP